MVFVSTDKLAIYSIYLVFLDLGLIKEVDWIFLHNMCKTIIKTSKYPFSWSSSPYRRQAEELSPDTFEFVWPCPSFHSLNFHKLQRSKNIFAFFFFVEHFVCKERRHSSGPNQYFIGRLEKKMMLMRRWGQTGRGIFCFVCDRKFDTRQGGGGGPLQLPVTTTNDDITCRQLMIFLLRNH